jgi:general secretion pathway protein A
MMTTYLEFYELMKPPFDVRPGKGPVLATEPLRDALGWVKERLDADDPILCVSGAPGIGRSSLARVLPGALAAHCRVARIVNPLHSWEEIRKLIFKQLLVDAELSRSSLVDARALGHRLVVVVDSAERADDEFLAHLDSLLDRRGPARERLVQAVFFAPDRRFSGALEPPLWGWLESRQGSTHELEPISPVEIHRYIRKRLENAGRRGGELFTETASLVIHQHTQGVPRRVNHSCDVVLREGLRRSTTKVDARLVADAIEACAGV